MGGKFVLIRLVCWVGLLVGGMLTIYGCGPSFPGTITILDPIDPSPVVALSLFDDKWMYVVDGEGKLRVYDLSTPDKPKRSTQVDAFKDDSYQIAYQRASQWLILIGKSGKIAIYDIRTPDAPNPLWGDGKVLKMPKYGPLMVRSDHPVLYMTPGDGTAVLRMDLGKLSSSATDQSILDGAISMIAGGGGGGIAMPFDENGSPVRVYVGNRTSGKIDIWNINEIETGAATKPVKSVDTKAGNGIKHVVQYQQKISDVIQGWLLVVSDGGEIEYFDLDKRYRQADDPKSTATATVGGFYYINNDSQLILSDQLDLWDFSAGLSKPVQIAKPELRATILLRDVLIYKEYIYTAETAGFNVYKFNKAASK